MGTRPTVTSEVAPTGEDPVQEVVPLTEPADGIPEVTSTAQALAAAVESMARGTGPVAVDAERASGYRYGQRAYLVQLRRAGAGTVLVDPVALPDLSSLSTALADAEWVLHAASQDLPCLAEVGLHPWRVFDTELAARLLGYERVGLAAVVARVLGLGLAKEHSAVDWSVRPLPEAWLRYAALDVEVLVDVRDRLADELAASGKTEWAAQEFEAERTAAPRPPRVDPWRRVSGLQAIRDVRRMAVVRELWNTREQDGQTRDISPGRILPDHAIVAAAQALPRSRDELVGLSAFAGRGQQRRAAFWQAAIDRALALPDDQLPAMRGPRTDAPPAPRTWPDRDPAAAARLTAARHVVAEVHAAVMVPAENLLQPDLLRRLCWSPPAVLDRASVGEFLSAGGARPWQVELLAEPLVAAFAKATPAG